MTYNNQSMLGILCKIEGSVFPKVLWRALFFGCLGALALTLHQLDAELYGAYVTKDTDMHTYMGMMVALLIGFRTNNCYARYQTGVAISGSMRTHARTLIGQACAYITPTAGQGDEHVRELRRLSMLLCLFFKRHMHGQDSSSGFTLQFSISATARAQQHQQRQHGGSGERMMEGALLSNVTEQSAAGEMSEWAGPLSADERAALGRCGNGTERVVLISIWLRQVRCVWN